MVPSSWFNWGNKDCLCPCQYFDKPFIWAFYIIGEIWPSSYRKRPHIPLNQCELKLSGIPSPPTAPREINSLDCMALPGKMLKNRFQESCWGPVDHQKESFFLQVLGEKVVALERLWAFASDTLQPLLFILFFILQVYLIPTQRCKKEEMLVVIC